MNESATLAFGRTAWPATGIGSADRLAPVRLKLVDQVVEQCLELAASPAERGVGIALVGAAGSGKTVMMAGIADALRSKAEAHDIVVVHMSADPGLRAASPESFLGSIADRVRQRQTRGFPWRNGDEAAWAEAVADLQRALDEKFGEGGGCAVLLLDDGDIYLPRIFSGTIPASALSAVPRLVTVQSRSPEPVGAYDLSQAVDLSPFTPEESLNLIGSASGMEANRHARLLAVYQILGSAEPRRFIMALYESVDAASASDVLRRLAFAEGSAFEQIVARLPVRPARLLDALIVGGEPARPSDLSARLGAAQSDLAPTFRDLLNAGLIERSPGSAGRLTFYQVRDRLFALWYLTQRGIQPITLEIADVLSAGLCAATSSDGEATIGEREAFSVLVGLDLSDPQAADKLADHPSWAGVAAADRAFVATVISFPIEASILRRLASALSARNLPAAAVLADAAARLPVPGGFQVPQQAIDLRKAESHPDARTAATLLRAQRSTAASRWQLLHSPSEGV